jgi:predicted nucleotidyltransferase
MRDLAREQLIAELLALRPIFQREGVTSMALFGSRSRGDHRPDSDIDLLIEIEPGRKFSLLDMAGIYAVVEDKVGLESSIVIREDADAKFLDRIASDLVPVFR